MPAAAHVLVTVGGIFGSGADAEVWQCGVKMTGKNADGSMFAGYVKDLTGYINSIYTPVQTWWTTAANRQRPDFQLGFVKAANIKPGTTQNPYGTYNGTTDANGGPNPAVHTYGTSGGGPTGGGTLTGAWPQILTLAATLRNKSAARGPRHSASHGRVYLPYVVTGSQERITDTTTWVAGATALLTALKKTAVPMTIPVLGDATCTLVPALVGVNGTINFVDRVEIGDVADTVRNRKSALRENYFGADWS